jgi:hypothetical protein
LYCKASDAHRYRARNCWSWDQGISTLNDFIEDRKKGKMARIPGIGLDFQETRMKGDHPAWMIKGSTGTWMKGRPQAVSSTFHPKMASGYPLCCVLDSDKR